MNFSQNIHGSHKNLTGVSVVAALHLLLLVFVLSGSRLTVFKAAPSVIDLQPMPPEAPPPKLDPPPVPLQQVAPPDLFVPVIEVPVVATNPPPLTTRALTEQVPPQQGPTGVADGAPKGPPVKAAPVQIAAVVDSNACAKPDYPKNSLRNGDTGVVTLALLIGIDGRVADSKIEKSSGVRELDRAAQVGLGLCKFKPGTLDGVPYQSWTRMQYVWNLND